MRNDETVWRFGPIQPARAGERLGDPAQFLGATNGGNMQAAIGKFHIRPLSGGCQVLECRGGLSWEDREQLAFCIEQHLVRQPDISTLVLDLREVEFVNSAGLGALFQIVQRVRGRGGQVCFAHVPTALARLFEAVGLNRLARSFATIEAAVSEAQRAPSELPARNGTGGTP